MKLTRVIGNRSLGELDPFLLLDEFRSDDRADYVAGFPDHPHRGFETVTYMLAGRMRHADNKGHEGSLGPGSVVNFALACAGVCAVVAVRELAQAAVLAGFRPRILLSALGGETAALRPVSRLRARSGRGVPMQRG